MLTDSSRVTRSAGSTAAAPPGPAPIRSPGSGSGSGMRPVHVVSRRARAEPSRLRQIRLATVVSQAPGDWMDSCCSRDMAYQRA